MALLKKSLSKPKKEKKIKEAPKGNMDMVICDYTLKIYPDQHIVHIEEDNKRCSIKYAIENFYRWENGSWHTRREGITYGKASALEEDGTRIGRQFSSINFPSNTPLPIAYKLSRAALVAIKAKYRMAKCYHAKHQWYHTDLFKKDFKIQHNGEDIDKLLKELFRHVSFIYQGRSFFERLSESARDLYNRVDRMTIRPENCKKENGRRHLSYLKKTKDPGVYKKYGIKLTQFIKGFGIDPNEYLRNNLGENIELRCSWGNTNEHKTEFSVQTQSRFSGSCQKTSGILSHAQGYGSVFTNGYIQPILMYRDADRTDIAARAMIREMYDDKGEMYLFIDKIYTVGGSIGNHSKKILREVTKYLLGEGYKCISSERSGIQYSKDLRIVQNNKTYRSGVYQAIKHHDNFIGYYNDSYTVCNPINGTKEFQVDSHSDTYSIYL